MVFQGWQQKRGENDFSKVRLYYALHGISKEQHSPVIHTQTQLSCPSMLENMEKQDNPYMQTASSSGNGCKAFEHANMIWSNRSSDNHLCSNSKHAWGQAEWDSWGFCVGKLWVSLHYILFSRCASRHLMAGLCPCPGSWWKGTDTFRDGNRVQRLHAELKMTSITPVVGTSLNRLFNVGKIRYRNQAVTCYLQTGKGMSPWS